MTHKEIIRNIRSKDSAKQQRGYETLYALIRQLIPGTFAKVPPSIREDWIAEAAAYVVRQVVRHFNAKKHVAGYEGLPAYIRMCATSYRSTLWAGYYTKRETRRRTEVSLDAAYDDDHCHHETVSDQTAADPTDDEEKYVAEVMRLLPTSLTPIELKALTGLYQGLKYTEIAEATGSNRKTIDNAIQRARVKLQHLCTGTNPLDTLRSKLQQRQNAAAASHQQQLEARNALDTYAAPSENASATSIDGSELETVN